MQFLIKCEDTSFCVIHQRSIMKAEKPKKLIKGSFVTFKWPEDSETANKYNGEIVDMSGKKSNL